MPGLQLSVVIATRNREQILRRTLAALAEQTLSATAYEVVVVDDASDDETPLWLRAWRPSHGHQVLRHQTQRGPGAARNTGVRAARAELVVFIDDDVVPAENFLEQHQAAHDGATNRIVHGPVIHTHDLEHPTTARQKRTDLSTAYFATGNVSVRKEHLLQAGLFDEDFKEYGWEDLEFGLRLRAQGLVGRRAPGPKGYHYKPRLRLAQLPGLVAREKARARTARIFYQKHPTREVRWMIGLIPLAFRLDRLITLGGWHARPGTRRLLVRLDRRGPHRLLRILVRVITWHAYMAELRSVFAGVPQARRYVR